MVQDISDPKSEQERRDEVLNEVYRVTTLVLDDPDSVEEHFARIDARKLYQDFDVISNVKMAVIIRENGLVVFVEYEQLRIDEPYDSFVIQTNIVFSSDGVGRVEKATYIPTYYLAAYQRGFRDYNAKKEFDVTDVCNNASIDASLEEAMTTILTDERNINLCLGRP